jgi:hypothetical protein
MELAVIGVSLSTVFLLGLVWFVRRYERMNINLEAHEFAEKKLVELAEQNEKITRKFTNARSLLAKLRDGKTKRARISKTGASKNS